MDTANTTLLARTLLMNKESTNEGDQRALETKKHHAAKPQLLVERSAHVEHRGREGEDMAYA